MSGEDCADTADKEPKQQQTEEEEEEKKKKKNKKRRDKAGFKYEEVDPIAKVNTLPEEKIQEVRKAVRLFLASQGPARTLEEAGRRSYPFWDTQPVPKIGETVTLHCCIVPDASGVREEPLSLPPGFSWDSLDLERPDSLKELHVLLSENYEEDDDAAFRLACGPQFLLWALRPPGRLPRWHCAVRADSGRKLVGFIGAAALDVRVHDTRKTMAHVKLLCVHKKLRKKRMAPVLIREMARRARLDGVFQGVYAAGPVLPKPVSTCRFWHRYLNPRKLIEVKFSHLSKNMTVQRALKLYRLPETTKTQGLRPMTRQDVPAVHLLLRDYLDQFQLVPIMSAEEVEHWLLPRHEVVSTYVVESAGGSVTDFVSFVTLPSTILNHPVHRSIKAARSFYTVHTRTPLVDLVEDALILAKAEGFDVFTALDLMENKTFLENLKFVIGDDRLNYYLYNWKCPGLRSEKVGFLLH